MISKLTDKRKVALLVFLCSAVYAVSYMTRINYSAVLVEIVRTEGFTKTAASAALTGLFVTYGAGQIVSGWLGDKYRPQALIFLGLLLSAAMNLAIPFCHSAVLITALWCVNGFAQALMWPPIVKIMTVRLTAADYKKNIMFVGWGSGIGTLVIYLMAPAVIEAYGWQPVFYVCAACAVIMAIAFILLIDKLTPDSLVAEAETGVAAIPPAGEKPAFSRYAVGMLLVIMLINTLQGALRDGTTTWMPSLVSDLFHTSSATSILTGVLLPVFHVITSTLTAFLYTRVIRNEAALGAVFFGICVIANGILLPASAGSPVLSVAMLTVLNACTHGINGLFTSYVVPNFNRFGRTSFVTGLINSATYIGSALSMCGVAYITEQWGWNASLLTWLIIGVLGLLVTLLFIRPLRRFRQEA